MNDYETPSNYGATNEGAKGAEQRAAQPRAELHPEDGYLQLVV